MKSFEQFSTSHEEEPGMEDIVRKEQDLHVRYAKEYLPEGSKLREEIIDFYSDTDRLKDELSNVYQGMSQEEIETRLEEKKDRYDDNTRFVEEFQKKFERTKAHRRRRKRLQESPKASEAEYELGVYKDALEWQVQDAVFELQEKGYRTFQSGFREAVDNRDQFVEMYNTKVDLPESAIEEFKEEEFEISLIEYDNSTEINIRPLSDEPVFLEEWKEVWDDLAEAMPEADDEDLSDRQEYGYHRDFRRRQDEMRGEWGVR